MPIVQVRSTLEGQWLSAPFPPTPNQLDVLTKWRKPIYKSELLVYPRGYMGNASPVGWRAASNFLLSVDNSGERAEMLVMGKLPDQKTPADIIAELKDATPEQAAAIGSTAILDERHKTVYVSTALGGNALAIGGLVMHTDPSELTVLRGWFPETTVQMHG